MPDGATVEVIVMNGRFSTPFSGNGWRGEVSGEISASGRLVGKGHIQKSGWRLRRQEFSAPYHDGAFTDRNIPTSGQLSLDFQITLRR